MKLRLRIPGNPVAKARPKFFRRGDHVGTYKPKAQEEAENQFVFYAKKQLRIQGAASPIPAGAAVRLKCWFFMPIPKSATKKFRELCRAESIPHTKKPDLDNLVKFVKDCLNGHAWHDDSQVVEIAGRKFYAENPMTFVVIETLEDAA